MQQSIEFDIRFKVVDNKVVGVINGIKGGMDNVVQASVKMGNQMSSTMNGIQKNIKNISFTSVLDQVDRVATGLDSLSAPGLKYSSAMADLSAITGLTGDKLDELGRKARDNAKTFGGDAAKSVEVYKILLSQLGPALADKPEILNAMAKNSETLAKTLGGDSARATGIMTTAMNQYGVSIDNPIRAQREMTDMMNAMAAAAKEGSAELDAQQAAINEVGGDAKRAKVGFNEMLSAIQMLDKGGLKESRGGIALRNVLTTLNQGRFLPKDVQSELRAAGVDINALSDKSKSLTDRLRVLNPVAGDSALMSKLFGRESQGAAQILINSTDAQDQLTKAITGTNTAQEQANTIMESAAEKQKRQQARIDDLKTSLFDLTGGMLGYASVLGNSVRDISNLLPLLGGMRFAYDKIRLALKAETWQLLWQNTLTLISTARSKAHALAIWGVEAATWAWNTAQKALNATFWLNPITWIIAAVIALTALIIYIAYKVDGWGTAWEGTMGVMSDTFSLFVQSFKLSWLIAKNSFLSGIDGIKMAWYSLMSLWDKEGAQKGMEGVRRAADERTKAMINQMVEMKKTSQSLMKNALKADSLKWNNKTVGDISNEFMQDLGLSGVMESAGISSPNGTPGVVGGDSPSGGGGTGGSGSGSGGGSGKTNEAIVTGGKKQTTININFNDMIGSMTVQGRDFKEAAGKMKEEIEDQLLRVLASANVAAG